MAVAQDLAVTRAIVSRAGQFQRAAVAQQEQVNCAKARLEVMRRRTAEREAEFRRWEAEHLPR